MDLPTNAIFSQNVILANYPEPMPCVIAFNKSRITHVIHVQGDLDDRLAELPDCQFENFQELFICPGIVDINVSFNEQDCEDAMNFSDQKQCYEIGTRQAASGGVTTVIETPGYGNGVTTVQQLQEKVKHLEEVALYCDIGLLATIGQQNYEEIADFKQQGVIGFKGYLIPPDNSTPVIDYQNLHKVFKRVYESGLTILLHSEHTNDRFLYMSSPFRNVSLKDRNNADKPRFSTYAGAFPDSIQHSSTEPSPISSFNSTPIRHLDEVFNYEDANLDRMVTRNKNDLGSLVNAERKTYDYSGITVFEPMPDISQSFKLNLTIVKGTQDIQLKPADNQGLFHQRSPIKPIHLEKKEAFRPPSIVCQKIEQPDDDTVYNSLVANCPPHWEVNCVDKIIKAYRKRPCKIHISNISASSAANKLRKYKKGYKDINLTYETSTPYLYFSSETIQDGDTRFKLCPPIRSSENRDLLIQMYELGGFDTITSYHRPVKPSMKFLQQGDFKRAQPGTASLGVTLQALMTVLAPDPRKDLPKLMNYLSLQPAKIMGINKLKGSIEVGKHADFFIFDPNDNHNHTDCFNQYPDLCIYLNQPLQGRVLQTFLRGSRVFNGQFEAASGKILENS